MSEKTSVVEVVKVDIVNGNANISHVPLKDWSEYDTWNAQHSKAMDEGKNKGTEMGSGWEKGHWKNGFYVSFSLQDKAEAEKIAEAILHFHGSLSISVSGKMITVASEGYQG